MKFPTSAQVIVGVRYLAVIWASVSGCLVALHFISGGDATKISDALTQLGTAAASIAQAVTVIIATGSTLYAMFKTSPTQQAKSLVAAANEAPGANATEAKVAIAQAVVDTKDLTIKGQILAPPEVAKAVPSVQVVSKDTP